MNVGQVLETHLGWACKKLGMKVATPVFDGIPEKRVREYLKEAKLPCRARARSTTAAPARKSTRRSSSATST
jgi:DNA-directed RNA polymerase subunit beta